MADQYLKWAGFTLGADSDGANQLRALSRPGQAAVTGLGSGGYDMASTARLAGGEYVGRIRPVGRTVEVPLLQCRSWETAAAFEASMVPGGTPGFLEIGGGPYSDPVGVYAYPTGAAARWDVDALGDREVVHVDGAGWFAPDPTIYSAAQTVRESGVRTGNWNVPAWTNPGRGVPSRGLGGHAWEAIIQVLPGSSPINYFRIARGAEAVYLHGPFPENTIIQIGADRVPTRTGTTGMVPVVPRSGTSATSSPSTNWPRFTGGASGSLVIAPSGPSGMSYQAVVTFRGTWS